MKRDLTNASWNNYALKHAKRLSQKQFHATGLSADAAFLISYVHASRDICGCLMFKAESAAMVHNQRHILYHE